MRNFPYQSPDTLLKGFGIAMMALVISACSAGEPPNAAGHFKWQEPEVDVSLVSQVIPFLDGYSSLDAQAAETLDAFLRRQIKTGQHPVLRIYGLSPLSGDESGDDSMINDDLLAQQQAVVAEYAAIRGFQSDLLPPRAARSDEANGIVVEAVRYVAIPPSCPDWSGSSNSGINNAPSSNFGCATARNLSLMVAHPRDLIQGRTLEPAQAVRFHKSLESYRQGETQQVEEVGLGQ